MEPPASLTLSLVTASAMTAGGMWMAARPRTWLTADRLRGMLALGAGFVLVLVMLELLPAALQHPGAEPHHVFRMALLGALAVFALDRWIAPRLRFLDPSPGRQEAHDHGDAHGCCSHLLGHGTASSVLGCLAVCTFFDGVALSAALGESGSLGLMVLVGMLLHLVPESLLASTLVLAAGGSAKVARRAVFAVSIAFLLGALVPALLQNLVGHALPLSAGILLFVALAQLLPIVSTTRSGATLFLSGGLLFFVLEQFLGHAH
ncbi:MAG: hypothetical protein FJZ00_07265 [Candidatus Sericytochromatia bacterium]|uniref:ZIP family metal transporter n=1 Tax=Candidatus Tanganyikabacteria bacterium TaxID=2961651 RepID=A0A937X692_9BACT|nr:hypothetical protein [Candidatus Tanganyikabacteria bacterium]